MFRRLTERRTLQGVVVGAVLDDQAAEALLFSRLDNALALISRHDPRRFQRLRRLVRGINVTNVGPDALGQWHRDSGLIEVQERFALDPDTLPEQLAAIIVHEITHAWLESLGFTYAEDRRTRIEAICGRSEISFASKLPDPKNLVERAAINLTRPASTWSNESLAERQLEYLLDLGAPQWLIGWLRRRRTKSRLTSI